MQQVITRQYTAATVMLLDSVQACSENEWLSNVGKNPFWKVAYHTLFYADLYLCLNEREFSPPTCHYPDAQFLGTSPYPPFEPVSLANPIGQKEVIHYGGDVKEHVAKIATRSSTELERQSGFSWIQLSNIELLLMSIRHIQHHTAQLQLHTSTSSQWISTA